MYIDDPLIYYRFGARFLNDLPDLEQIPSITSDLLRLYQKINSMDNRKSSLFDKSILSDVHEKAAYWYFARKAYVIGMEHLLKSGKLNHTNLDTIMTNLGYWGAYSAVEYKGADPISCELDFNEEFAPSVMTLIKKEIVLSTGDYKRLFSSFYHNLAWHLFPGVNGNPIRLLCVKAIVNNPFYLFSVQTMKMLLVSTCYYAREWILKAGGHPTKAGID